MCKYKSKRVEKKASIDAKIKRLRRLGKSYPEIGRIVGVSRSTAEKVVKDKFSKVHKVTSYRAKKRDWEKIDEECCERFNKLIKEDPSMIITRKKVAEALGLKDKSFRNLPKLRAILKKLYTYYRVE